MTFEDRLHDALARAAQQVEPADRLDEVTRDAAASSRPHRRVPAPRRRHLAVGFAAVAATTSLIAGGLVIAHRDDEPTSRTSTISGASTTTTEPWMTPVRSDCPAATPLLRGSADGLPNIESTRRSAVESAVATNRAAILAAHPGAIDVRVVPRNGQVWEGVNGGDYRVVDVDDFQIQVIIADVASCPLVPWSMGAPLIFTLAPTKSLVTSDQLAFTSSLRTFDRDGQPMAAATAGASGTLVIGALGGRLARLDDGSIVDVPWGTAFAGAFGDSVWAASGTSIREFAPDGSPLGRQHELPKGRSVVSVFGKSYATAEGLLTFREDGDDRWLETWDPNTGAVVHTIGNAWNVVAVHTDVAAGTSVVAWIPKTCLAHPIGFCDMSLTELPSNRTRTIAAPVFSFGFMGGGAFSPDGRTLAAIIDMSTTFATDPRGQLVLIDTATDTLNRVPASDVAVGEPYVYVVWTPDGSQLVFGGLDDYAKTFRLTGSGAHDTRIPGSYSLTIVAG